MFEVALLILLGCVIFHLWRIREELAQIRQDARVREKHEQSRATIAAFEAEYGTTGSSTTPS